MTPSQIVTAITRGLVQRMPLAREVSKRLMSMLADAIAQAIKRTVVAFWTGGIGTALLILVVVVIAVPVVVGALPLSAGSRASLDSSLYGLMLALFVLRLLVYMVRSR
jgi:hypothetical protein